MKIILECEPKEMADLIINLSQPFEIKTFVPEIKVALNKSNCHQDLSTDDNIAKAIMRCQRSLKQ